MQEFVEAAFQEEREAGISGVYIVAWRYHENAFSVEQSFHIAHGEQ